MRVYLSDNGEWVLVERNDVDPPEEMLVEEFIAVYGEDALPKRESTPCVDKTVKRYYDVFRALCKACGEYAWAAKTEVNHADGVFPVQKIVWETFGGNAEAKLAGEVNRCDRNRRGWVKSLDKVSRQIGYKPMSNKDKEVLLTHLNDRDFRERLRYRIDKYAKAGTPYSARELVIEVLKSFQKK